MKNDFASFLDTLRKIDARHRIASGGEQYTMDVAQGPSASAKNQALMRAKKVKPKKPLGLAAFIRQQR